MIVVLDAGPLGRLSNPRASALNTACYQWMEGLVRQGTPVFVPEIADYEVRRELLRGRKARGLARLDLLKETLGYSPITTPIMLKAAELWAEARQHGQPTANPQALDCDVILAAHALSLNALVATENVGHLSRFVDARPWQEITVNAGQ
jgi:predicted nucleic acid-binding protein